MAEETLDVEALQDKKVKPPTPKPRRGKHGVSEDESHNENDISDKSSGEGNDTDSNTKQEDVNESNGGFVEEVKREGKKKHSKRKHVEGNDVAEEDNSKGHVEKENDTGDERNDTSAPECNENNVDEGQKSGDDPMTTVTDRMVDGGNNGESESDNKKGVVSNDNAVENTEANLEKRLHDGDGGSSTSSNASDQTKPNGNVSAGPIKSETPRLRRRHLLSETGRSGSLDLDIPSVSQQPSRQPSGRSSESESAMSISDIVLQDSPK